MAPKLEAFRKRPYIFLKAWMNMYINGCPRERHFMQGVNGSPAKYRLDGHINRWERIALRGMLTRPIFNELFVGLPEIPPAGRASYVMRTFFRWDEITNIKAAIRTVRVAVLHKILFRHGLLHSESVRATRIGEGRHHSNGGAA